MQVERSGENVIVIVLPSHCKAMVAPSKAWNLADLPCPFSFGLWITFPSSISSLLHQLFESVAHAVFSRRFSSPRLVNSTLEDALLVVGAGGLTTGGPEPT